MSRLMTYRTLLACLLAALLALLVAGQQQRAFERIWFKLEQRYGGDVARAWPTIGSISKPACWARSPTCRRCPSTPAGAAWSA